MTGTPVEKRVTHEDIPGLSENIRKIYRFLFPDGLTLETLRVRAQEHSFFRVIYQNYLAEQERGMNDGK